MRARSSGAAVLAFVTVIILGLAGGCRVGESRFESTVLGRSFDVSGTAFAYLDAHDEALVSVDDNPRVAIVLTWIIFDPNADLNDLEGSALEDYSHELKLRDALALVFDEQGNVTTDATAKSVVRGGFEEGSGALLSRLHLAPERLDADSTYDGVVPLASERETTVTITNANFADAARSISADVSINFNRRDDDPGDALTGAFQGSFIAPIVEERKAEQNLALLDVADVLGLPLPPEAP